MHGYRIVNQNHIHFVTPTIVGWIDIFTRKVYKDIIISSLKYCIDHKGLNVHAYVIMSNHIHMIVSSREGYILSDVIRDFKSYTAYMIIKELKENSIESRQVWILKLLKYFAKYNSNNTKYQLWKRDNHPVELISNKWIGRKINYIHQNPVRAGIVNKEEEYTYSSSRDYMGIEGIIKIEMLETHT